LASPEETNMARAKGRSAEILGNHAHDRTRTNGILLYKKLLQRLHRNRDVHGAQLTIIAYVTCPHFQLVQISNSDDIVTGEDGLLGLDWKSSAHGSWQGEMLWMRRRNWHRRRSADGHLNIGSGDRPHLENVEVHEVEKEASPTVRHPLIIVRLLTGGTGILVHHIIRRLASVKYLPNRCDVVTWTIPDPSTCHPIRLHKRVQTRGRLPNEATTHVLKASRGPMRRSFGIYKSSRCCN
jgi:hypothetical protein